MLHRLAVANARKDPAMLREVADLLRELLSAWEQVAITPRQPSTASAIRVHDLASVS